MSMNFEIVNSNLRGRLANGLSHHVPPFQRDYSWTVVEWDDLWQDISDLFGDDAEPAHYMGYLVLRTKNNKEFHVIDGQQRLTTLSLLVLSSLAHLRRLQEADLDAKDNALRYKQLQSNFIGYVDPVNLTAALKLELNRNNRRFYQHYLAPLGILPLPQRGLSGSDLLLRECFYWFEEKVKERFGLREESGKELAAFLDSMADKLFFTVITVPDDLNAFRIFETLNARGMRLSATDLLKNYLFLLVSKGSAPELDMEKLESHWDHVINVLGGAQFPVFLHVFWNSRYQLVRKPHLFKTIRKAICSRDKSLGLLQNLDQSAEVYAALLDPEDKRWKSGEREDIESLQIFQVRQAMPMLLACYESLFENARREFERILHAVVVISFRYNVIGSRDLSAQEHMYNKIAMDVTNGSLARARDVIDALRSMYPDDSAFRADFEDKSIRDKRVVRYILFTLERQISKLDLNTDNSDYTVEHILPVQPSEEWYEMEVYKQDRSMHRLGNMTLLEAAANREVGNAGYATKRAAYARSALPEARRIAERYPVWDEKTINARQKEMAKAAASIWRIDFSDRA